MRLYTTTEFMALALDPGKRYELVKGVIQAMSHPGGEHSLTSENLMLALGSFVRSNKLGRVIPAGGFELKLDPTRNTVRSPDLAFIPTHLANTLDSGVIKVTSDLAVEIYSPNDRPGLLREKLEDYRKAGWDLIWVIYPPAAPAKYCNQVHIYHLKQKPDPIKELGLSDQLQGEDQLQSFLLPVKDLFDYQ
jgi:Uma2 family endonuclease